jgi:hypothetical protein
MQNPPVETKNESTDEKKEVIREENKEKSKLSFLVFVGIILIVLVIIIFSCKKLSKLANEK